MTGPQFYLDVAPKELYKKFGYPLLNDGDRESLGTYIFVSDIGHVITIYYRANDVFGLFLRLFKRFFWHINRPLQLTIGAEHKAQAEEFSKWIIQEVPCLILNTYRPRVVAQGKISDIRTKR